MPKSLLRSAAIVGAWQLLGASIAAAGPPEDSRTPVQSKEARRPPSERPDGGAQPAADKSPADKAAPAAAKAGEKAPRPTVPLAPSKEELERLRAAQRKEPEQGAGAGTAKLLRRPFPTSTGNTAGPGANQGAGTNQDRKAATLEAGGPTHGVRR